MRRYLPLLLVLALVSTACKVRFDTALTINADESGRFAIEMGFDEEFRALSEESGGGEFGDLTSGMEDVPANWGVEEFTDGEFEGIRIFVDFDNLAQLNASLDELAAASDDPAASGDMFGDLQVSRDGDAFSFRTDPLTLGDDLGAESGFEGLDMSAMLDQFFQIRLKVTLPGTPGDHNADLVEGNTFIWNIGVADEGSSFFANSSGGGSGLNPAFIAVAVLLLAIAAWLVLARRNAGGGGNGGGLTTGVGDPVDPVDGDPFGAEVPESV